MICEFCGEQKEGHFCWPSYCVNRLGRDCQRCSNACLVMRNRLVNEEKKKAGRIVVEEIQESKDKKKAGRIVVEET